MEDQFLNDVVNGLGKERKTLPSKYFYNKKGDKLFQQIMSMPEYYLTRAEMEVFVHQSEKIIEELDMNKSVPFQIIELGAGDGTKTVKLLKSLLDLDYQFEYIPIDISKNALVGLENRLKEQLPSLSVTTKQGTYFNILKDLKGGEKPKIILFLGSNIGNLMDQDASKFIYELGACLKKDDKILLGVDVKKSKEIVLPAYNDKQGITKEFNLNLLDRINAELGGNFDRSKFEHAPEYTEEEGIARSYIRSLEPQQIELKLAGKSFRLEKNELIHTEISRKYSDEIVNEILSPTDITIKAKFMDSKELFADYILTKQ